jgi:hypothetical protein
MGNFSIDSIGGSKTQSSAFMKREEQEGNAAQQVAYAGIPNIGSLLNGSQNQTQSTASGIRA